MPARYLLPIIALFFLGTSCGKKRALAPVPGMDTTQTYFSVRQYIQDQMTVYWGQPYSLNRFETREGKTDSSMVNFYNMEWGPVYAAFLATDISATKYLGHYRFSRFEEGISGNFVLNYEAMEKELYTRSLQITVDPTNNRILSIYIVAAKDGNSRKLLYIPLKVIQIQESGAGKKHNYRLEYRFLE